MKKLVFNYYISRDTIHCEVNKLHLWCLKHYADIFDDMVIIISLDDLNDRDLIIEAEDMFRGIHTKGTLTFKISQNTVYRESLGFKEEIADRLGQDNLVFFAHNKGITNVGKYDKDVIYAWIIGMYFYNLQFMDEVVNCFYNKKTITYGAFLTHNPENRLPIKHQWFYAGTFFWISSKKLKQYIDNNSISLPQFGDRFYDEEFLGQIIEHDASLPYVMSHNNAFLIAECDNYYLYCKDYIDIIYEEHYDFDDFFNTIKNSIFE